MSDLPPYLTHIEGRHTAWTQHAAFPRNVVKTFYANQHYWHHGLRVFKLELNDLSYRLVSSAEIEWYMEDPARA